MCGNAEIHRLIVRAFRDFELALGRPRHSGFVDRADHDSGAKSFRQIEDFQKPFFAIFIVRRVQNAFAPCMLESRLHLLPFRGIEHQWNLDVSHQTRCQFVHIRDTIAPDKIDVHIQYVRALSFLVLRKRDQAVPVAKVQKVPHLFRAAGVYPFANDQKRTVLNIGLLHINR